MKKFDSYVEAFDWWLENRAESPEYEQGKAARDLIIRWLSDADKEIEKLNQELNQ